jgi:hypothetical protein
MAYFAGFTIGNTVCHHVRLTGLIYYFNITIFCLSCLPWPITTEQLLMYTSNFVCILKKKRKRMYLRGKLERLILDQLQLMYVWS